MLDTMLHVFSPSFLLVFLGEMGDKTQLLSLALVCRFHKPWAILLAITLATLANHGVSVWLGEWIASLMHDGVLKYVVAASFMALGIWMLIPDKQEEVKGPARFGVFLTAFVLFFLAEIGDKTQLATVALAAHYQSFFVVLLATTLGMIAANGPILWLGERLQNTCWEKMAHLLSAMLFIVMGLIALFWH